MADKNPYASRPWLLDPNNGVKGRKPRPKRMRSRPKTGSHKNNDCATNDHCLLCFHHDASHRGTLGELHPDDAAICVECPDHICQEG